MLVKPLPQQSQPRILVVDDDRLMVMILTTLLRQEGYLLLEQARDGSEALTKFVGYKPNIVIMDIEMPEMDGIETLRAMKEFGIVTQVLMISSFPTAERVRACASAGAAGFLVKPVSQKKIADAITFCLKRSDRVGGEIELFTGN